MKNLITIITILLIIFSVSILFAERGDKKISKINGTPSYTKFNINNVSTFIFNNGTSDISLNGNSGFEYPKLSGKAVMFQSGLMWGAKVNGEIRVGGSNYNTGLLPGKIQIDGTAEDQNSWNVRIYRVRRDFSDLNNRDNIDVSIEAEDESKSESEIRNQYISDWAEWPAGDGAPYEDIDNDGTYNPLVDIPGIPGADQTIWFVANDIDPLTAQYFEGSLPLGIEMQTTVWGYKYDDVLSNIMFKKYILINKSSDNFADMYISMWSDPDVGTAVDDYVGCDSLLNLGYSYNGSDYDGIYELTPPAVGFKIVQGPVTEGELSDEADFMGRKISGKKNLGISAFTYFISGAQDFNDPMLGDYSGTLGYYNTMRGLGVETGNSFTDINGNETKILLAGDPIAQTGWLDGMLHPASDRRMVMSAGPFEMASGDTQEVIYAEIAGVGKDRFESIKYLRYYASLVNDKINNVKLNFNLNADLLLNTTNNDIISLYWDNDPSITTQIENFNEEGFLFEGYNIYQLNSDVPLKSGGVKIEAYDLINGITSSTGTVMNPETGYPESGNIVFGNDNGISRFINIDHDYLTNSKLIKGKNYYFGLSYFTIKNDNGKIDIKESPLNVIEVEYNRNENGFNYGDPIKVKRTEGIGDAEILAFVTDPDFLNGHDYQVGFNLSGGNYFWLLEDLNTNEIVLSGIEVIMVDKNQLNSTNFLNSVEWTQTEFGFRIAVYRPTEGFVKNGDGIVEVRYGGEAIPEFGWDVTGAPFSGNTVWHDSNWGGENNDRDRYFVTSSNDGSLFRMERYASYASPYDFEFRFSANGSLAVFAFEDHKIASVPFELWNIGIATPDDPSDDYRMIPFILSQGGETTDTWTWAGGYDFQSNKILSDPVYWMDPLDITPGESGYNLFKLSCESAGGAGAIYEFSFDQDQDAQNFNSDMHGGFVYPIGRFVFADEDQDGNMPPAGTVVRLNTIKPLTSLDKYSFSTNPNSITTVNDIQLPSDYKLEQNYPNPFNPTTKIKFSLPEAGIVKLDIYNILGQKVASLLNQQMNPGIYEKNFNAVNLSSGVYIYTLNVNSKIIDTRKMVFIK